MALLLAAVGWPFLRLTLVGERQRLRRSDFFHLALSGVAGLAIVTILVLDGAAYWRFNRDHDTQLSLLADQVEMQAATEVNRAYQQLTCLETWLDTDTRLRLPSWVR